MIELIDTVFDNVGSTVEFLTIIISLAGMAISLQHGLYFRKINKELAIRIRQNFLWDAAVYAVTFVMGVALFLNLTWLIQIDVIIRPFVLFFAVLASVRLYLHYKDIAKK